MSAYLLSRAGSELLIRPVRIVGFDGSIVLELGWRRDDLIIVIFRLLDVGNAGALSLRRTRGDGGRHLGDCVGTAARRVVSRFVKSEWLMIEEQEEEEEM